MLEEHANYINLLPGAGGVIRQTLHHSRKHTIFVPRFVRWAGVPILVRMHTTDAERFQVLHREQSSLENMSWSQSDGFRSVTGVQLQGCKAEGALQGTATIGNGSS